jgi:MFS transporter, DHA2 family, methylenomycin A resistance protein
MITTPTQQVTQKSRSQTMMPLLALCLGYFMTILDVTIVNIALVNIKEHLSANVTGLQWIVDGYALVFASLLLTGGVLGDRRGNRTIFLAGFTLFTLASTLCSLAPTLLVLQVARAFQGLGAALLVPNSLALLNTIYTDARKRAQAIGFWAAVASIGGAFWSPSWWVFGQRVWVAQHLSDQSPHWHYRLSAHFAFHCSIDSTGRTQS